VSKFRASSVCEPPVYLLPVLLVRRYATDDRLKVCSRRNPSFTVRIKNDRFVPTTVRRLPTQVWSLLSRNSTAASWPSGR